jgi:site-specific recombinase XerD
MPTTWTAHKIHFLTQPELRTLLQAITRTRDRALFLIAYRHGLRASEVGMLRVDDLNFEQQRITIHRVKRSLPGIYPLQADEIKVLKAYLRARKNHSPTLFLSQRGTPISRRQLDTLMKSYGAQAGIPASKRHFHVLKHSIATHLLDAGAKAGHNRYWWRIVQNDANSLICRG